MDASTRDDRKVQYKTSPRVQAWFLGRSRTRWKKRSMKLKADNKRLQNRVADVTKSRAKWREEAEQLSRRVQELEAQHAASPEQVAALKKDGPDAGGRSGR